MAIVADLAINEEADEVFQEFARKRIKEQVKDPIVAEKLTPDFGYVCKRPLMDNGHYFETFNRPNVKLHSLPHDGQIVSFSENGIQTEGGVHHDLDIVIFATGFDALVGFTKDIEIIGENGRNLKDKYSQHVSTYLGVMTEGFPNLFFLTGPQSPSVFSNMLASIEQQTNWLHRVLTHLRATHKVIRVDPEAEKAWSLHSDTIASMVLFTKSNCKSWYKGDNIEGKRRQFLPYAGGLNVYHAKCEDVLEKGLEGFILEPHVSTKTEF